MAEIANPHGIEAVPVNPISIGKVDLSDLLNNNSPRIKKWETDWKTRLIVIADLNIVLFNQCIKPNIEGKFMSDQKEAIAKGRPEEAWSGILMNALTNALRNAMQDREGISSSRTAPLIGIISHIDKDLLTIEVKDNGGDA